MANSKRRCKYCRGYFSEWITLPAGTFCTLDHAIAWQADKRKADAEKQYKQRTAEKKRQIRDNDRGYWLKKAQAAFNAFIRQRDHDRPCISCGRPNDGLHQRHASHYRSVGACSSVRFDERNVNASCSVCNNHLSGNILEYRIRLVKKIGLEAVEWIEAQPKARRWSIDELKEICKKYKDIQS